MLSAVALNGHPLAMTAWILVLLLWVASEAWLGLRRHPGPQANRQDRGSRLVIVVGVGLGVTLATGLGRVPSDQPPGGLQAGIFLLGILMMLSGIAFRLYAVRVLGRFFTLEVATQAGQLVIDRGPYRLVRHPSYTGFFLTFAGFCLTLRNWLAILGVLPVVAAFAYRVRVEEATLQRVLGEDYEAYMRRTKRFLPYIV